MHSKLRTKIQDRLDALEANMIANKHIEDPINIMSVLVQTRDIAKFWSALSEEERDFIHCVRHAVEAQIEWKV
ncbi:MAG: hypothetical protein ABNH04_12320 [Lentibacter sp.]